MRRFIVVLLASLFLCVVAYHFIPSIASTAFMVPTHQFEGGATVGGFGVTWTMILFMGSLVGCWKLAAK